MIKNKLTTIEQAEFMINNLLDESLSNYTNETHETSAFCSALTKFKGDLHSKLLLAFTPKMENLKRANYYISNDEKDLRDSDAIVLYGIDFSNRPLTNYNFDDKILINVSFKESQLTNCRFRNTCLYCCDLRYTDIDGGTFENSNIWWCDFYRSYFQGVIRFVNAIISDTSINNAYFSGATLIRKMNFKDKSLLQMDKNTYKNFLLIWDAIRDNTDKIKTNDNIIGEEKINRIVNRRFEELEFIFKNLSSTFTATGFSNDSNWAYVQGKKAERSVLMKNLSVKNIFSNKIRQQLTILWKWFTNIISDLAFGYGESLIRICCTYLVIVTFFTFIYMYECNIQSITKAFIISFKNMVGSSDELALEDNIFLSVLNVTQTTLGILITGIFGFILGNKIRNQ